MNLSHYLSHFLMFDPALVVHIAALLLIGKVKPVVQAQNLLVSDLGHEHVLETRAANNATTPGVGSEPELLQHTQLVVVVRAYDIFRRFSRVIVRK